MLICKQKHQYQLNPPPKNRTTQVTAKGPAHDHERGSFLTEDIVNIEAEWLKSVNNVAAAACKDKTTDEIFRLIGGELGKMGVSSVFFTREPEGETLISSSVTLSSGGIPVYPASTGREKVSISSFDSEIIGRVLSQGEVILTTNPGTLGYLFPTLPGDAVASAGPLSFICAPP
jgi:hypothetical protein